VALRELEDVSKKAGITELEWEDQRKQLLATIDGTALKLLPKSNLASDTNHHHLALCSPRRRAQPAENAGGAIG
jgi:ATP-dependent exoDNAse (exonuclease V) alpha subunit